MVDKELHDFQQWCQDSWNTPVRSFQKIFDSGTAQIRDRVEFSKSSAKLKLHIADILIRESCSHIGSLVESGDVSWYLHNFARELDGTVDGFKGRRLQPVKAALLLTSLSRFSSALPGDQCDLDHILSGGSAMSAMYLLAQLEFLCRMNGRYLRNDGTVHRKIPTQLRMKVGLRSNPKRINQIQQALALYLYRNRTPLGKRLRGLEGTIGMVDRLGAIRNPVMHGELPDPGVEAKFFGLLIAMFYYDQSPEVV